MDDIHVNGYDYMTGPIAVFDCTGPPFPGPGIGVRVRVRRTPGMADRNRI